VSPLSPGPRRLVDIFAILSDGDPVDVQVRVQPRPEPEAALGASGALARSRLPREATFEDLVHPPNSPSSQSMAHPIPTYAQPQGTLAPGQTISVNKFTVQVERYLSQGELHRFNRDRLFRNTTAHQAQPNYRRLRSCIPRTDLGAGVWDNTPCSQEDRGRKRCYAYGCEEGG